MSAVAAHTDPTEFMLPTYHKDELQKGTLTLSENLDSLVSTPVAMVTPRTCSRSITIYIHSKYVLLYVHLMSQLLLVFMHTTTRTTTRTM